ncbi:hypothetical protein ACM0IS_02210 [Mycoplasma aquilae ATCC BAA-1896]|uniref:hypothetical protein n=1 Tax=Mycoplasma aquilae TaxID=1312741 RepID=UPI003A8B2E1A
MKKRKALLLASCLALPLSTLTVLGASSNTTTSPVSVSNTDVWKNNDLSYVYFGTQWASTEYPKYYGQYQANQWMKDVNGMKTIFQMSLPGTHDSGAWEGAGPAWGLGWRFARTQSMNYMQQMYAGIRAFDIRCDAYLNVRHGVTYLASKFEDVLNNIVTFLDKNPSEFVFLRVKDEPDAINVNNSWNQNNVAKEYLKLLSEPRIYNKLFNPTGKEYDQLTMDDFRLKNLRGKIVIANFWHHKVLGKMIDIQKDYKAKVWSGGFNYWEAIQRNTMQDNFNDSVEQKYTDGINFMPIANANSYDSRMLYLNFFSVAGGYPYNSSQTLDPKFNKYLSDNEQFTKLGIVYMDYPGPAIIQNVYKRNYYLTDMQLQNNYINTWNSALTASNPLVNDNHITIQGQNLAGYHVDIKQGNKVIASFEVPEGTSNQYTATLREDLYFPLDASYTVNAYKLTPANAFYQARAYNQFSYNVTVINTPHNQNIEAFEAEISQWKDKILHEYNLSNLDTYLKTTYLDVIGTILRPTVENETKLSQLKSKFEQDVLNMDNLSKLLQSTISTNNALLEKNNTNLASLLQANTIHALKLDLKVNFNVQLNNNISNSEINFSSVKDYINNYLNMNVNLCLDADIFARVTKLMSKIEASFRYENLGLEVWKKKLDSYKETLSTLDSAFNQSYDIKNGLNTYLALKVQLSEFSTELLKVSNFISQLNDLIAKYQLAEPEVLLFASEIKPAIESLSNLEQVEEAFKDYGNTLTQAHSLIEQNDTFQTTYQFNAFMTETRQAYLDQINKLILEMQAQKQNPIVLADLKAQIAQIEELKSKIIKLYPNEKTIYESKNLFDWQKTDYIKMLSSLSEDNKQTQVTQLMEQIKQINDLNPLQVTQEDFLAPLNSNERKLLDFNPSTDLDPETFIAKFNSILKLRNKTIALSQASQTLNNISLALADTDILSTEQKDELTKILSQSEETLANSSDLSAYTTALQSIAKMQDSLANDYKQSVDKIINQINTSNKLFTYQKNILKGQITGQDLTIDNIKAYILAEKEFTQAQNQNLPQAKEALLDALSQEQKQAEIVILNAEQDQESFNNKLSQALDLNDFIKTINSSFNALNYSKEAYYINASSQEQENINSLASDFSSKVATSLDKKQIQDSYDALLNALNQLKEKYLEYLANKKELIKQLNSLIKQLQEFSIPHLETYKTNYLNLANQYIDLLNDDTKPFSQKAEVLDLIKNISHLLQVAPNWKRDYDKINDLIAQGKKAFDKPAYQTVLEQFIKVVTQVTTSNQYQAKDFASIDSNALQPLLEELTQTYQDGIKQCKQIDLAIKKQELNNQLQEVIKNILPEAKEKVLAHLASLINQIKDKINQLSQIQGAGIISQDIDTLENSIVSDNNYVQAYKKLQSQIQEAKSQAASLYNLPAYHNMLQPYVTGLDNLQNELNFNFNTQELAKIQQDFGKYIDNAAQARTLALSQYNSAKEAYDIALKQLSNYASILTNPLFKDLKASLENIIAQDQLSPELSTQQIKTLTSQIQGQLVNGQTQEKELINQVINNLKVSLTNTTDKLTNLEISNFKVIKEQLLEQSQKISANISPLSFNLDNLAQYQTEIKTLDSTIQSTIELQPQYKELLNTLQEYQTKANEFQQPANLKLIYNAYLNDLKAIAAHSIFAPNELEQVSVSLIQATSQEIAQAYKKALQAKHELEMKQNDLKLELSTIAKMQNEIPAIIQANEAKFKNLLNQIDSLDKISNAINIQDQMKALKQNLTNELAYNNAYETAVKELQGLLAQAKDFSLPIEKDIQANYQAQIDAITKELQYNFNINQLLILEQKAHEAYNSTKEQSNMLIQKYQAIQEEINQLANSFKQFLVDNQAKLSVQKETITKFINDQIQKASMDNLTFSELNDIYTKIQNFFSEVKKSIHIPDPKPNSKPNNPDSKPTPEEQKPTQGSNSHAAYAWFSLLLIPVIGLLIYLPLKLKKRKK